MRVGLLVAEIHSLKIKYLGKFELKERYFEGLMGWQN
jgi:hypothetical protein